MARDDIPFNLPLPLLVVAAIVGLIFLVGLGLQAGFTYIILLVAGVIALVIAFIAKKSGAQFWFEIPINKGFRKALLMLFFGIFLLGAIAFISNSTGLTFYSPFFIAPVAFEGGLGVGANTFSALEAAASPFWTFFVVVFTAAVVEEIVLGWAFVVIGSLVGGLLLRKLLGLDMSAKAAEFFDFVMAMIVSIVLFTTLHVLNGTYVDAAGNVNYEFFAFAAGFRLIMNLFIYKFGNFGLSFSIGVHAMNNAIFLGAATVQAALLTFPGGIIILLIIALFVWALIRSIPSILEDGIIQSFAKDFIDFD